LVEVAVIGFTMGGVVVLKFSRDNVGDIVDRYAHDMEIF
jgi:hypothetical protein